MTWNSPPPRPNVVPFEGSQQSRIEQAIEALEGALDDDALFLWTGGKEANVVADLLLYAVGDQQGQSPIPWGVIDTGNHFPEMYAFREEYCAVTGDRRAETVGPFAGVMDVVTERHDGLIDVIEDPDDPRGYHGEWDHDVPLPDHGRTLAPRDPEEWDVAASCGALKVVPIRRFVEKHGYDVLVTGRRGDDPLVEGDSGFGVRHTVRKPVPHERVNPLAGWSEPNVYAYIAQESVPLPSLYTEDGYRHTDSVCCTDNEAVGEYGEGGRDPDKMSARERLNDMGYV